MYDMKKCAPLIIACALLFGCQLTAMDQEQAKDEIIGFNIGGYTFDAYRSTIKNFGGHVLNEVIGDKFQVVKRDAQGRIFIDRPKAEAKLILYFIHHQRLPGKYDRVVALRAAKYFGIENMQKWLKERRAKKWSEIRCMERCVVKKYTGEWLSAEFHRGDCVECNDEEEDCNFSRIHLAIAHLINEHGAKIESKFLYERDGSEFGIHYHVPLDGIRKR